MADYRAIPQGYMTVGEVAKKMDITIRTLQYYDHIGLFSPSCISDGGRRLYNDEDIVKLHQILTLKSLGFSLDEIKNCLIAIDTPQKAITTLTEQSHSIQAQINMLTQSLQAINLLISEIEKMQVVDFSKYADIIINLQMKNKCYGLIKYFDENMLNYCHKKFDKNTAEKFINKFNKILNKIEQYIKSNITPDSNQGQSVAKEFWQLIIEFTNGDMSILPQLVNFASIQTSDSECRNLQNYLNCFIKPALETYFNNSGINPFEVKK